MTPGVRSVVPGDGRRRRRALLLVACGLFLIAASIHLAIQCRSGGSRHDSRELATNGLLFDNVLGPCAINFYGLPRSFRDLVLPSILQNVVRPNMFRQCDFYIHYHSIDGREPPGRDGRGGIVHADEILLLKERIHELIPNVRVEFSNSTDDDFWRERGALLEEIHSVRDAEGQLLYMPVNHPSYTNATVDNVIKMWHGQQAVWNLMESSGNHYSRVAMLRCDVVYVTPIDIYSLPTEVTGRNPFGSLFWRSSTTRRLDTKNEFAVIPDFANHPVNDRLIYGPYDAVRVWASSRFDLLQAHIQYVQKHKPGDGIHSERYLAYTVFPAITINVGVSILPDSSICFLRARSDRSLRFDDCDGRNSLYSSSEEQNKIQIEKMLNTKCRKTVNGKLVHLDCETPHVVQ